ncbi:hypothetical protein [Streptomyces sp. NPDC001275]
MTTAPAAMSWLLRNLDRHARDLRDVVIEGATVEAQGGGRMREYLETLKLVQAAMRADLVL